MLNFVFFYKKSIKKFCSVKSICIFVKEITTKKIEIMTFELNKTLSKSGRRTMWFPTVEGKRITRTNFGAKWEAEKVGKLYLEFKKSN